MTSCHSLFWHLKWLVRLLLLYHRKILSLYGVFSSLLIHITHVSMIRPRVCLVSQSVVAFFFNVWIKVSWIKIALSSLCAVRNILSFYLSRTIITWFFCCCCCLFICFVLFLWRSIILRVISHTSSYSTEKNSQTTTFLILPLEQSHCLLVHLASALSFP